MADNDKPGCLSTIFPFLKRANPTPEALPYCLRDDFLSVAEFSFYKVLLSLIGPRLTIQSKVRLADIFFVARPNENISHFNRITNKHLDFLVCDTLTMRPLFAVELDDSSHQRRDRQERDDFVESVCRVAGLPLLRFRAQREYNTKEIEVQIAPLVQRLATGSPQTPQAVKPVEGTPVCPKCGIPMVMRIVTQGEHKGKRFYGCRNYPNCREVKPVN